MDAATTIRLSTPEPPEAKNSVKSMAIAIFFEITLACTQEFSEFIENMKEWCTLDFIMSRLEECIRRSPKSLLKLCQEYGVKPMRVLVPLLAFITLIALSSTEGYKIFFLIPIYKTF